MSVIKNFFTKTIKRQLLFSVAFANVLLMAIFIYIVANTQKEFLHEQSLSQAKSLTKTLAKNSTSWVLANDFIGMEEIIDSISTYSDLKYAMLLGRDGKVLSHTDEKYNGKYISDSVSLKILDSKPEIIILVNDSIVVDIAIPILRKAQHIGWARVALSQNENTKAMKVITDLGLFYTIFAVVISTLFAFILATSLTRGLYKLITIAQQTTSGKKNIRAQINRGDEIGLLSIEVNNMLDKIEEDERELENVNQRLEEKVESKTYELQKLNENLELRVKDEVTQNLKKEQMLYQQSKMASMGEMIGNIAHQWRQPIAVISMWANNIIADIDMEEVDTKSLKIYANNINEQTNHLSQTIDDFRNFFSPNKEESTFTLKSSIDKTMSLLSASFKANSIEVIEEIEDIEITALENELTQAILNIIKNAKDILVTLPSDAKRLLFINIYSNNKKLYIEIIDNGGGVPADIIDKVFEPYFTTKHKSQGTGIGLYMTESIVTKHLDGTVYVQNVEYEYEGVNYKGAKFTIEL